MRSTRSPRLAAWLCVLLFIISGPSLLGCACGGFIVAPVLFVGQPAQFARCMPPPRYTPSTSPGAITPTPSTHP